MINTGLGGCGGIFEVRTIGVARGAVILDNHPIVPVGGCISVRAGGRWSGCWTARCYVTVFAVLTS